MPNPTGGSRWIVQTQPTNRKKDSPIPPAETGGLFTPNLSSGGGRRGLNNPPASAGGIPQEGRSGRQGLNNPPASAGGITAGCQAPKWEIAVSPYFPQRRRELETLISPTLYQSAFARGMAEALILQLNAKFGELDPGLSCWVQMLERPRLVELALALPKFQSEMDFLAWVHSTKEFGYITVSRPRRQATAKAKK